MKTVIDIQGPGRWQGAGVQVASFPPDKYGGRGFISFNLCKISKDRKQIEIVSKESRR